MTDSLEKTVTMLREEAASAAKQRASVSPEQVSRLLTAIADRLAALPCSKQKLNAAQLVFDCTLRAVNDLNTSMGHRSLQYTPQWIEGWATLLRDAGFTPTNPDAGDIKRGLAKLPPPPTVDEREG